MRVLISGAPIRGHSTSIRVQVLNACIVYHCVVYPTRIMVNILYFVVNNAYFSLNLCGGICALQYTLDDDSVSAVASDHTQLCPVQ